MITLILTSLFNEQKYKNYTPTQISKLFQYPHPFNPSDTNRDSILRNTKKKSLHQHSKLKTPFTRLKHQKLKTFNSNQKKINRTAQKFARHTINDRSVCFGSNVCFYCTAYIVYTWRKAVSHTCHDRSIHNAIMSMGNR